MTACECGGAAAAGRGRARHLVLLVAVAVLQPSAGPNDDRRPRRRSIPANVLVTAPEILFFWVARMVMAGCEFMGEIPFHTVYLHGTVRDTQHRKMSQVARQRDRPARGGGALRRRRAALHPGVGHVGGHRRDPRPERPRDVVRAGPQLRQQALERRALHPDQPGRPTPAARRSRQCAAGQGADAGRPLDHRALRCHHPRGHRGVRAVPAQRCGGRGLPLPLERPRRLVHRADQAAPLRRRARRRRRPAPSRSRTFDVALRLLHPVMPFVTEALWQRIPGRQDGTWLATAPWPAPDAARVGTRRASASSRWCRSWWAPFAPSAPSTTCRRARRCASSCSTRATRRARAFAAEAGNDPPAGQGSRARLRRERATPWAATRCCPTAPASSCHSATPSTWRASASGSAPSSRGSSSSSGPRRRSSATSSSWPARRRRGRRRSGRSWRRWTEQAAALGREAGAARMLGSAAPRRALRALLRPRRPARPVLRQDRAPAGRPPRRRGTAGSWCRSSPSQLSVSPGFRRRRQLHLQRSGFRGRQPSQGIGTGDLERLVLLSPTSKVPVVQWQREPHHGAAARGVARRTRVYRVELLPGVTDLRNNRASRAASSPSPPARRCPTTPCRAAAYDWTTSQPMRGGAARGGAGAGQPGLHARLTDSSGTFSFGPLPRGEYLVYVGSTRTANGSDRPPRGVRQRARADPTRARCPSSGPSFTTPRHRASRRPRSRIPSPST